MDFCAIEIIKLCYVMFESKVTGDYVSALVKGEVRF